VRQPDSLGELSIQLPRQVGSSPGNHSAQHRCTGRRRRTSNRCHQAGCRLIRGGPGIAGLTAYEEAGRQPGESSRADRELLLHAARERDLRRPYLEFLEQSERQIAVLIQGALRHIGLQLTIPVDHPIRMLGAVHEQSNCSRSCGRAVAAGVPHPPALSS
jgi:hypothetical protein